MTLRESAELIVSRNAEEYRPFGIHAHSMICEGTSCADCFLCETPNDPTIIWQNAHDYLASIKEETLWQ